jgi:hypothetical protein
MIVSPPLASSGALAMLAEPPLVATHLLLDPPENQLRPLGDLVVSVLARPGTEHVAGSEDGDRPQFHRRSWRSDEVAALAASSPTAPPTTPSAFLAS